MFHNYSKSGALFYISQSTNSYGLYLPICVAKGVAYAFFTYCRTL